MKKLFDEIPHQEGERLILRRITENDRETLREMANSNIVYRYEPTYLLEQQASTMVDNKASAHVLEKNGFMSTNTIYREDWGHDKSTAAYRWFL